MREEWRQVVGWEGWYEVSSRGRLRRVGAHAQMARFGPNRVRKLSLQQGYYHTRITAPGGRFLYTAVHRLVAVAFLPPRPTPDHEVNHIDGVKTNNHVTNLEWVTSAENSEHARRLGLTPACKGEKNREAKLTESEVRAIRFMWAHELAGQRTLARSYGVSQTCIWHIVSRNTWKHVR